jgi:hypothetical protein
LQREGRRSQYRGTTDDPKHPELLHDRTSILIIAPYEDNADHCSLCSPTTVYLNQNTEFGSPLGNQFTVTRFVVAFANTFAAVCLSDFGAMSLTPGLRSDVVGPGFKEQSKESL